MPYEFNRLENSLKEFIVEAQSNSYNAKNMDLYKYNNLKINMDARRIASPHFTVRIGISEASYSIETCERIAGSLGMDEKFIPRWFNKSNIKEEIEAIWKTSKKTETIKLNELDKD